MSLKIYTRIPSACGAVPAYRIEVEDADLNPHGISCCGLCDCIIEARESWADEYGMWW